MRARNRELPPGAGAEHGIETGLVGIGDALRETPTSFSDALARTEQEHGAKAARMLRRFAELPVGSVVWTRTIGGRYAVGRISGAWRYDNSTDAHRVGIHHVRPTRWERRLLGPEDVPVAVVETFARGGRNLQRIHSDVAERQTAALVDPDDRGL